MDYYNILLQSYSKIKKRSFNPLNEEKKGTDLPKTSKTSDEAHELALQYINRAASLADADENAVDVPESDPGTKLYVAKEGKRKGQIVVQQGGGAPLPITDTSLQALRSHPAYKMFASSLDKARKKAEEQAQKQVKIPEPINQPKVKGKKQQPIPQPQQPEEEIVDPSQQEPEIDPLFDLPITPVSLDFHKKISKSSDNMFNLGKNTTLFLTLNPKYKSKISMIGPDGKPDYSQLREIVSGDDPLSIKSRMATSISAKVIGKDPESSIKVAKQLSTRQKEIVTEKFEKFTECINRLYGKKFTAEDMLFLEKSIKIDGHGFWIMDPSLEGGVCIVGRLTPSNVQGSTRPDEHVFPVMSHMVERCNALLRQWALNQKEFKSTKGIRFSNAKVIERDTANFNEVRGKSAERYRMAIHALSQGNYQLAASLIKETSDQYNKSLKDAYAVITPFLRGESGATMPVINLNQLIENLKKIRSEQPLNITDKPKFEEFDLPSIQNIIPKLTRFELQSSFLRQPESMEHTGNIEYEYGFNADNLEYYESGDIIRDILVEKYGMDPIEAEEYTKNVKEISPGESKSVLPIGLKTYTTEGKVKLAERTLSIFHTKVQEKHPHIMKTINMFGTTHEDVTSKVRDMDSIIIGLNNLFSKKVVPGYTTQEINANTINGFLERMKVSSNYKELAEIEKIKEKDLEDSSVKLSVRNRLKRAVILAKIKTECDRKDNNGNLTESAYKWRRYVAVMAYGQAATIQPMLTEARFFNTGNNYIINHNKALREELIKFASGEYKISSDAKGIHISTGKQYGNVLNIAFAIAMRDPKATNLVTEIYFRRDALRRYKLNPKVPANESLSEQMLETLIKEALDIYHQVVDKSLLKIN